MREKLLRLKTAIERELELEAKAMPAPWLFQHGDGSYDDELACSARNLHRANLECIMRLVEACLGCHQCKGELFHARTPPQGSKPEGKYDCAFCFGFFVRPYLDQPAIQKWMEESR